MSIAAKPYWPELEDKLHEWVLEKRQNGIGLSGAMIRLKYIIIILTIFSRALYFSEFIE